MHAGGDDRSPLAGLSGLLCFCVWWTKITHQAFSTLCINIYYFVIKHDCANLDVVILNCVNISKHLDVHVLNVSEFKHSAQFTHSFSLLNLTILH